MNTTKTIAYDYSFNSSKKILYNGKIVDGADLDVSILAFNKKGEQVELVDGMKLLKGIISVLSFVHTSVEIIFSALSVGKMC